MELIESQDQRTRAQNEEILTLKMAVKAHADEMVTLKSEMKAKTKRIQALEREQAREIQTIRSQAKEIEDLRKLQFEKIEVCQGCAEKTHKEQEAGMDDQKKTIFLYFINMRLFIEYVF